MAQIDWRIDEQGATEIDRPARPGQRGAGQSRAASGAIFLHRGQQGPHGWVTLADPEGNEFCVS